MYSTSFNKVAQVIILMCLISFTIIKCKEILQFSNQFEDASIRAKRSRSSVGQTGRLANQLYNLSVENAKEHVTDNYRSPQDPKSYGKK
uniref:Uncharacterized protein n=1 Tax=Strongyloides papillosus TaxID=174720 RepID=A0A0N5B8V8_STREA